MQYTKPDQVKAQYQDVMGSELGATFCDLVWQVHYLDQSWADYVTFFGKSRERVELLNEISGPFAARLQRSLFNSVITHVTRLLDRKETYRRDNLTFSRLQHLLSQYGNDELANQVSDMLQQVDLAIEECRQLRHKAVAHLDFMVATGAEQLTGPSRKNVNQIIDTLKQIISKVHSAYMSSDLSMDRGRVNDLEAEALIITLQDGLELERQRSQRVKDGNVLASDMQPRNYV